MKILYITTVAGTMNFFKSFIGSLVEAGNTVDIATNNYRGTLARCYEEWKCNACSIEFSRNPLSKDNLSAMKKLKKLVEENRYDIVHCHTPVAAMCARIACKSLRKKGIRVVYTAHGFHFYKGAPLLNWLLYFPVEWICAWWTDVLITINSEDFAFAKKYLHAKDVQYVPGVGIDIEESENLEIDVRKKREELGLRDEDKMLLSVGELNPNKNHEVVIRALAKMHDNHLHYYIAGSGFLKDKLETLAVDLGIPNQVHFLGFRQDVKELLKIADVFVFPSKREGLPVSIMEAVSMKTIVVCSDIRGNRDLIKDKCYWFDPNNVDDVLERIEFILKNENSEVIEENYKTLKVFDKTNVNKLMMTLYEHI